MSHINKIEELKELKRYLNFKSSETLSKKEIYDILDFLIPRNEEGKLLANFTVSDNDFYRVGYFPKYNTIIIPKKKFESVSIKSAQILSNEIEKIDLNRIIRYYELFALLHEVEHAY